MIQNHPRNKPDLCGPPILGFEGGLGHIGGEMKPTDSNYRGCGRQTRAPERLLRRMYEDSCDDGVRSPLDGILVTVAGTE